MLHHHLRRGGVTRVMRTAARILRDAGEEVELVAGEAPVEALPEGVGLRILPELGYGESCDPAALEALTDTLSALTGQGDVWHLHNHSLGKNPLVTAAVIRLAERGLPLVLQIHDFAEDGRPENFARLRRTLPEAGRLYPAGANVRYAVLQERDRAVLADAGVPEERLRVLPNPVPAEPPAAPPESPPRRILYLSRMIRRKNTGEFLYWALRHGRDLEFATSLIPQNPAELAGFQLWQAFAERIGVSVAWGLGLGGKRYREVMEWGDACVTTSVGEGYGMSFLEPVRMGRPVLGRDLPEITADFKRDGVDLSGLYQRLPVPVDRLDPEFWSRAARAAGQWRASMGVPGEVTERELRTAWVEEDCVDFGRLDETAQRRVLETVARDGAPEEMRRVTLGLDAPQPLEANRRVLDRHYDDASALRHLKELYAGLEPGVDPAFADADKVRDAFLDVKTLTLLRT